jgi:beta-lactamase regulating signal transducer with metallopeptidase domain
MSILKIDWPEFSLQMMITFGHFLWQACVFGCVLLIVQYLVASLRGSQILALRRRSNQGARPELTELCGANIPYTIACLTFFALPLCVVITFVFVHQSRGPILMATSEPAQAIKPPAALSPDRIPTPGTVEVAVLPSVEMTPDTEIHSIEPQQLTRSAFPSALRTDSLQSFAPYLLLSYMFGVGVMLARFGLSIVGSSRLRQTLRPITDSDLMRLIAEQSARLGLKRLPIVALCERVSVPVVVGMVRPMILLPPALLSGLDPNQLAALLSHEMAHIRRYDLIVNLLQRIVEALLFFHPVTWWISRCVSIERENCCDDLAAAGCGRFEYAESLLRMAEQCASIRGLKIAPQLESLAADGGNTSQLGYRIRRLIGSEETTRVGLTRRSFSMGLALFSLVAVVGTEATI